MILALLVGGLLAVASQARAAEFPWGNLSIGCDEALGFGCNQGVCLAHTCQCNHDWSNSADFVELEACDTSIVAIYILWGINLAALIWCAYKSAFVVLLRFENFFEQRKTKHNYTLWNNKGLIAVLCYFAMSFPPHLILTIWSLVNPTRRIGFEAGPTALFFLAKTGFYLAVVFVQGPMLAAALKGDSSAAYVVRRNYMVVSINNAMSIVIGGFAFITLMYFSYNNETGRQIQVMRAYYLLQALALYGNGLNAMLVKFEVNRVLTKASALQAGQKRSDHIRAKINELQSSASKQGLIQGTVYTIMGCVPFFINKHQYFLPMSWLAMVVLGKTLAHQIVVDKDSGSLMQRLGIQRTGGSSSAKDDGMSAGAVVPTGGKGSQKSFQNTDIVPSSMAPMSSSFQGNAPGRKPKKHQPSDASSFLSEGTLLEELIDSNHPYHKKFSQFVKARFAENEMGLFEQLSKYRYLKAPKDLQKLGSVIIKDYIVENAPKQVDLPYEMRESVLASVKDGSYLPKTFEQIRRQLRFDLTGNFASAFERQMEATSGGQQPESLGG